MNTSKSLDSIIDSIQDYTIQSALGGSPFKSEDENKADNDKAYTEGRAKAKQAIVEAVEGIYGDSDGLREFAGFNLIKPVPEVPSKRREQNE